MVKKMIWIIGKILQEIYNLNNRFICRYILHSFSKTGTNCHLEGPGHFSSDKILIGSNVFIGANAYWISSEANIYIGNNVMFGPNVMISTGNHRYDVIGKYMIDVKEKRDKDDEDVVIEDDVWIGMGAIILKGVTVRKRFDNWSRNSCYTFN